MLYQLVWPPSSRGPLHFTQLPLRCDLNSLFLKHCQLSGFRCTWDDFVWSQLGFNMIYWFRNSSAYKWSCTCSGASLGLGAMQLPWNGAEPGLVKPCQSSAGSAWNQLKLLCATCHAPGKSKFGRTVTRCPTSAMWSYFWLSAAHCLWWILAGDRLVCRTTLMSLLHDPQHGHGPEPLLAAYICITAELTNPPAIHTAGNHGAETSKLSELKLTSSEVPELAHFQALQAYRAA